VFDYVFGILSWKNKSKQQRGLIGLGYLLDVFRNSINKADYTGQADQNNIFFKHREKFSSHDVNRRVIND